MEPTYFAQYKGFEFHCSPQRLAGGTFLPRLVVSSSNDEGLVEVPVDVPPEAFQDPTAAAHLAFAFGRRWVDGGLEAHAQPVTELKLIQNSPPLLPG